MGTAKTKAQFAMLMKNLAGFQNGPENSTPLGPNGEKKFSRLNLDSKERKRVKVMLIDSKWLHMLANGKR